MATTKAKITEQCQRIYSRFVDRENIEPVVYKAEIMLLVEQALNESLREQAAPSNEYGGVEIPSAGIIEFTGAAITISDLASGTEIDIGAYPISLPHDLGWWRVYHVDTPWDPYIPIPKESAMVFGDTPASFLEGKTGYFVKRGNLIKFTNQLSAQATNPVASATDIVIEVFLSDFDQFGTNDLLPIGAEIERTVIRKVLESLSDGRISQSELATTNNQ